MLTFKVKLKVKPESFRSCLQLQQSSYYSLFSGLPCARTNLTNCNTFRPSPLIVHLIFFQRIWITILDLEPNPCFHIFLNISKSTHLIFICNVSGWVLQLDQEHILPPSGQKVNIYGKIPHGIWSYNTCTRSASTSLNWHKYTV